MLFQKLNLTFYEKNEGTKLIKLMSFVVFYFLQSNCFGQQAVVYDDFPRDWQLFQRDSVNKAIVPVKGKVVVNSYDNISVILTREDKVNGTLFYKKQALKYDNLSRASFDFQLPITAGLINYEIALYLIRGKDSTLLDARKKIVCGDVMLFYGQSNALAFPDIENYKSENQFCRTIYVEDFVKGTSFLYYQQWGTEEHIGSFAAEFARLITNNYKIPICIINGAVGSTTVKQLSDRDSINAQNPATYYGKFLIQTELAKLRSKAQMMVFRQGESEALVQTPYLADHYFEDFEKLYKYWVKDFQALKKIYLFQNNIYYDVNSSAGKLRDYQGRCSKIFDKIQTIATIGTKGFDGLHYNTAGYVQSGLELSRIVGKDFYGDKNTQNVDSPIIQKCILSDSKNSISLVFGTNQTLITPKDTTVANIDGKLILWKLKDYIYIDGKSDKIDKITVDGNRAFLALKDTISAKAVTYLPAYFNDYNNYKGVTLKNQLGMRALTFENFGIAHPIKFNFVKTILSLGNEAKIEWQVDIQGNPKITIERAKNSEQIFTPIIVLQNGESSFLDKNLENGTTYRYRLKAESQTSESDYSQVYELKTTAILTGFEQTHDDEVLKIYPNPVENEKLTIKLNSEYNSLIIRDLQGKIIREFDNLSQNLLQISVENIPPGLYFVEILTKDNHKFTKKIIIP